MVDHSRDVKPREIEIAVKVIWVWIAFLALSGIYQAHLDMGQLANSIPPEVMDMIPPPLQMSSRSLFAIIASGYVLMALTMYGVAISAGNGKNWGRITLVVSFLFDAIVSAFSSYNNNLDLIIMVIDLGLQIYVLWLLYTSPGRDWFKPQKHS